MQEHLISYHKDQSFNPSAYKDRFILLRCDSFEELGNYICRFVWSPCAWWFGTRLKSKFLKVSLCALDFDDGRLTLDGAKLWCKERNLAFILAITKSHQKEKTQASGRIIPAVDRFRLVIPFSAPITNLAQYEHNMKHMMQHLPADRSCTDGARFFFPCKDIVAVGDGRSIAPIPKEVSEKAEAEIKKRFICQTKRDVSAGRMPNWIKHMVMHGANEGERHKTCYKIAATLAVFGWDEVKIVDLLVSGPLADIGLAEVERQVRYGYAKGRQNVK